jgi:hypothetical protein
VVFRPLGRWPPLWLLALVEAGEVQTVIIAKLDWLSEQLWSRSSTSQIWTNPITKTRTMRFRRRRLTRCRPSVLDNLKGSPHKSPYSPLETVVGSDRGADKLLNRFGSPHWTHFELLRCKTWSDRTIPIAFSSMTSARYLHAHPDWGPGLDKSRTSQVVNPADGVPALPTRSFFFQFHAVRNGLH